MARRRTPVPAKFIQPAEETASEPQLNYLRGLRDGKDLSSLTQEQIDWVMEADFDTYPSELPKKRMGTVIETLKKLPWLPKNRSDKSDLPDGRYGLRNVPGHKNQVSFFRLRTPKEGDWKGYQFIDQIVGHGKRFPVKEQATRTKIREMIKDMGVVESLQLFGIEFEHCGRCGRELTDDTSRARGIGPDCWEILGMS